ncbi:MAG: formylglycine-generating enzyme family protein, partial [Spirochaetes bacterium]|nr:formylglycine-generating enzyme family protein [Spirochaetota bacterium]
MKRIIISLLIMSCVIITDIYPDNFRIIAKIETVRKDNHITLLFDEIPAEKSYYIIENQFKIGSIEVINIDTIKAGSRTYYRVLAAYTVDEGKNKLIRAGADVGLDVIKKQAAPETEAVKPAEEAVLPQKIISEIDKREMLLVLGGKFLMGSDTGDKDEYPERIIHVSDFYIDRFEVPNSAYLMYIKEMNLKPPALWKDGKFTEVESDFPVVVAYSEAEGYAK